MSKFSVNVGLMSLTLSAVLSTSVYAADGTLLEKANLAESQKSYDEALSLYNDALSAKDNVEAATLGVARTTAALGKYSEAESVMKNYVAENPFSVDARLTSADIYRKDSHYDLALKEIRVAEQLQPGSVAATEQRAYIFFDQGSFGNSVALLNTVVKSTPDNSLARLRRAQSFMALGQYPQAVSDFSVLAEATPTNVRVHLALGDAYVKAHELKKAEEVYKFALNLDPQSSEIMEQIGDLRSEQKNYKDAIASYKQCIEASPNQFSAGAKLANTYMALNQVNEAEAEYARELKIDPNYAPAAQKVVEIWTAENRFNQVGSFLGQYFAKHPTQTWAAVTYAKLLIKIGQNDVAQATLEKTRRQTNEKNVEVSTLLASLEVKKGNRSGALDLLLTAEKDAPTDVRVKYDIAVLHDHLGHSEQAINKYREIPSGSNFYYKAQVNLAFLYEGKKQFKDAIIALKSIQGRGDQDQLIEKKIAELEKANTATADRAIASEGKK